MCKCERCGKEDTLYEMPPLAAWRYLCLYCVERMGFGTSELKPANTACIRLETGAANADSESNPAVSSG